MRQSKPAAKENVSKEGDNFVLVPPDGGYGWVIAFAYFLIMGTSVTLQMSFGLLYKDVFTELNFSPTEISILMNINLGVGQGFALFNGPLIRLFGYRKMAVVGAVLISVGMVFTSLAASIIQCMIVYGVITSIGAGMVLQSSQVAINTYFKEKKGKAVGIAITGVGVSAILMPQIIVALLTAYGPRGACIIMAGVAMQSFVGAALFQPVKHHMKRKLLDPEQPLLQSQDKTDCKEEDFQAHKESKPDKSDINRSNSAQNEDVGNGHENVGDAVELSVHQNNEAADSERNRISRTFPEKTDDSEEPLLLNSNNVSVNIEEGPEERLDTGNKLESEKGDDENLGENNVKNNRASLKKSSLAKITKGEEIKEKGVIVEILSAVSSTLDLSILTNFVYANIIVGMSLAFASETNFSMMTPLIMASMGFSTDKVATIMSTMAFIDVAARFLTPFVVGKFKINARTVYFFSMLLLVIFRSILVLLSTFESVMILGVALGIAKGIRNVYINLVIPTYIPIERLASAIGLQMCCSAVLFLCFGPILGMVVEATNDYDSCILAVNGITLVAIVMWLVELVAFKKKSQRTAENTS